MLVVGGNFERGKALDGMNALLRIVAAARDAAYSTAALEPAKRAMIAGWRKAMSTNEGVAGLLEDAIAGGSRVEGVGDFPARVRADRGPASHRCAPLPDHVGLAAVFVGPPSEVAGIEAPGFGRATPADGYGRPIAPTRTQ
jgi:hypothetical protein